MVSEGMERVIKMAFQQGEELDNKMEDEGILTIEDCLKMLDELKSDKFGILLDTGHCNINGENFEEIIPKCKGLPFHIHLDDNNGDSDSHLIPGKGNADYKGLVCALKEINYSGYISAELSAAYCMNPTSACRETLTFLKDVFKG